MSDTSRRIIRGRKHGLCPKLGCGVTKSYEITEQPDFPKPIYLGPNTIGWWEHEVDAWLESRPRTRPVHSERAAKGREAVARGRKRDREWWDERQRHAHERGEAV